MILTYTDKDNNERKCEAPDDLTRIYIFNYTHCTKIPSNEFAPMRFIYGTPDTLEHPLYLPVAIEKRLAAAQIPVSADTPIKVKLFHTTGTADKGYWRIERIPD